jgi:hypothetical protein
MTPDIDARRADELDAAITSLLAGGGVPAPDEAASPDLRLVAAVARLSASLEPEPAFAADLEARLHTAPPPEASLPPGALGGGNGRSGRAPRTRLPRPLWRWWLPLAAMLLLSLLLVPQARAEIQTLIRIGAVRIGLVPHAQPRQQTGANATPTPTPLASPLDLAGATTLAQARAQVSFPIVLPTYPPDLGPPQHVFAQNLGGPSVALVWVAAEQPRTVQLALFEMSNSMYVEKSGARIVAQTSVDGQPALWTEGPYLVQVLVDGQVVTDTRRLVAGHVLIWTAGGITYRLETDRSLDEAVRIAESLR